MIDCFLYSKLKGGYKAGKRNNYLTPEKLMSNQEKVMQPRKIKVYKKVQIFSTHLLIMEVDFCPVLCIPEVAVLQAFRGISHFVWYCKAVADLS